MKTFTPKAADVDRQWFVVDAAGVPLGRMATQVATLLMGKHKPTYAPHMDMGDFVVVVNAEKTVLTGNKETQKVYYKPSTRPGHMKQETAAERRVRRPNLLVEDAVRRMLPKNRLGRAMYRKLKVYAGEEHPHQAQQPEPYDVASAT